MRFKSRKTLLCCLVLVSQLAAPDGHANEGLELFEKWIRPTLIEKCITCHGPEEQEGGLQLDLRAGWVAGGDSGTAIKVGQPDASLLIRAVRYEDASLEMPPDGKLPEQTIAAFEKWVRLGAPDPRNESATGLVEKNDGVSIEEGRKFWAFQPIERPPIPAVRNERWPANDIDRLVLARLEQEGLDPVPDSDSISLVRRLFFDLTGLPPTASDIEEFLVDPAGNYGALVNRLLDSPEFGERWGRHWLDVVRFAQSSGGGRTLLFPNAWRYRDYVIESFNRDLPYDKFLVEQIAGDLLPSRDVSEKQRRLIATAFLLLGPTNYELQDKTILEMDIVDEQLDTLGKAMLGMTIGCARCHDHKFDPIPTRDYYAMAGILKSTKAVRHENVSTWNKVSLPLPEDEEARVAAGEAQVEQAREDLGAARSAWRDAQRVKQRDDKSGDAIQRLKQNVDRLAASLKQIETEAPRRPIAMAVDENEEPGDIPIAIRGVVHNRGPVVERGVLQVATLNGFGPIKESASGRLELANWIADANSPLTARVMANRVWHWLMGRGIVRTVDNFGSMGEEPSHPQLLDYLAAAFIADDWSMKKLIRRIVMSRTYQLSADGHVAESHPDPGNRLRWRMDRRRLEAEEIRDALLLISGELDTARGGPNIKAGTTIEYGYQFDDSLRRSVYLPVFRNTLPELFEVFDFADPNIQGGKRSVSTIAPQALLLMNHPFVIERARSAAARLLRNTEADRSTRLTTAYRAVLGRSPTVAERQACLQFLGGQSESEELQDWTMVYQTLFQSLDFRYLN